MSYIGIKYLWIDFKRKGKILLNKKTKEKVSKKTNSKKILKYFFKKIKYENVKIYEKIGVIDPFVTSFALPIVSLITTVPLNFLKIDYNNFKYEIIPDYNSLVLQFRLDADASFRIIDLITCIIKDKVVKNRS